MNDPRYIAWLNRRKSGPKASEVKVEEPAEHGNERDVVKHEDGLDSSDKLQLTGLSSEVAAGRGQFNARAQRDAKPFLEIVNPAQAAVGSLWLGKDEHGNDVEVPASINRFLRIYQREGVRFFWKHYAKNEGGLLGDDMGLGKTIQVISFLAAIMGGCCAPGCSFPISRSELAPLSRHRWRLIARRGLACARPHHSSRRT